MDMKMILGLVARHALTTFAGVLVSKGYLDASGTEGFVGAGLLFLGVGWSWWQKSGKVLVDAALAKAKGVHPNA